MGKLYCSKNLQKLGAGEISTQTINFGTIFFGVIQIKIQSFFLKYVNKLGDYSNQQAFCISNK